ncbi:erf4-like protein [Dermatophagoides farinae]|uniref:Ras modification protein ERF4 n=1 Tax=Dermatophagoides farinae TaxID=6954 RepID=A0A9D4SGN1_DERFA|nr:golgin subfamily A member 7-like [Dermatophagoides farinae]KAH7641212.1 erf4-like protein [Dermatophagoides farinae]
MDHQAKPSSTMNTVKKIFIQRDYSQGTNIRFDTTFPKEFRDDKDNKDKDFKNKIDIKTYTDFIITLNTMYGEAEQMNAKVCMESCFACLTAYLTYLCFDTYFDKCLKKISAYIDEQNDIVFHPRGLHVTDPIERGLRVIEISTTISNNNER